MAGLTGAIPGEDRDPVASHPVANDPSSLAGVPRIEPYRPDRDLAGPPPGPLQAPAANGRRSMRIQAGQLVALGYGRYVRSDEVVAVEPIVEDRGPGRRSLVWVRGLPEPVVGSRSEGAVVDDLVTPAEEAARMRHLRTALERTATALESVPPVLRRVIEQETGIDLTDLVDGARRALDE